nr:uncharacterized protein LOC118679804 [Bactrocera oleae]XP_036212634.1 uncharacterized protein LOC118679804 [Bactrocera oleae]XP_036212635.1 uncharacterized protein LOC118679804 [Bactrocera oleae]XP_036212637.1 uncharacterized protein LOC118679804 [Bactrocera oleae]
MPSCSGAQQVKLTAAGAEKANPKEAPPCRTTCSDSSDSERASTGGVRKRKRKRGGRLPPLLPNGSPGGQDDPRRRGMSGASLKWYLRHLQEGKTPEEAEKLARNRVRGDNASPASEKRKGGNTAASSKNSSGNRSQRPVKGSAFDHPSRKTQEWAANATGTTKHQAAEKHTGDRRQPLRPKEASASAVIASRFTADGLGIPLIQEPWIYKGEVRGLKMVNSKVIWDLSSERPRTCIVIRNDIDYFCISEFLTQDLVAVQAKSNEGADFVLAAAYFPGDTLTAPPEAVGNLEDYCRRNNLPLVMGCDANAHHTEWGSTDCSTRVL